MKKLLLIFLLFITFFSFSQNEKKKKTFVVINVEILNIRNKPNSNSKIEAKAKKGEKYFVKDTIGNWLEITYSPGFDTVFTGYIHKDYVKLIGNEDGVINSENEINGQDLSFKQGFKKYGIAFFIGVYMILSGIDILSNRVKDARYKDGYRYKQDTQKVLKLLLYTVLISLPLALIAGVITHFA